MLEGLYSAASAMEAQQQRMDALSNDVANVDTVGYRSQRVGFRDLIYQPDGPSGVRTGAGSALTQLGESYQEGPIQQTGQPFDLAINGPGFFQVRTASGQIALTRAGNFQVDAIGQLTDPNGNVLVPPVRIPLGTNPTSVSISQTGVVSAGGRQLGQITLATVAAPTALSPAGGNLLLPTAQSGPIQAVAPGGALIQQGALEQSDVDLASAMTNIMDAQRSYALDSRAITTQDQMLQIANQLRAG